MVGESCCSGVHICGVCRVTLTRYELPRHKEERKVLVRNNYLFVGMKLTLFTEFRIFTSEDALCCHERSEGQQSPRGCEKLDEVNNENLIPLIHCIISCEIMLHRKPCLKRRKSYI